MRRLLIVLGAIALLMVVALPASATVHEQVGAACGGQKDLAPPGISGGSNPIAGNFAKPVNANGVVKVTSPGNVEITDHPAAKYPEGTKVLIDFVGQPLPDLDHPANHCKALRP